MSALLILRTGLLRSVICHCAVARDGLTRHASTPYIVVQKYGLHDVLVCDVSGVASQLVRTSLHAEVAKPGASYRIPTLEAALL